MKRIDLTGEKFCLLTVDSYAKTENGYAYWNCTCDCGNKTIVRGSNLKSGEVKSCGCLTHRFSANRTHGESKSKLYRHWISMIYRCSKPNNHAYKWYGGRGISVCDEWKTYEGFKQWVQKTRPDESYTCERIDVNGDYCPQNCTWIPLNKQQNNRTTCIVIEYNGKRKNLTEWCKEYGIDYYLVHNRIYKLGWDFEKALFTPVDVKKRNKNRK